ncbi:glycosyltransferase [Candidatus Saccharibacteria bacterium]|nr:glycosyltransferase [Candidatus Saccharibacteria bacterium]
MKIVIATAVYSPMINGVAVFSHNLAVGLAVRGNEVLVLCPSQTGRNYSEMQDGVKVCYLKSVEAKVYPDQIHEVPKKRHLFYRHGFRVSVFPRAEVAKILNEFNPDVVHVQVSDPIGLSVVGYARRHEIPVVTTEHNQPEVLTEPLHIPRLVKKPVNALLSAYFRNRQSKSDFVTMPTKQAIEHLIYAKGEEFPVPVAAVSNGVDLSHFKPGRAEKAMYEKYGVPEGRPIVLYVGRVDPEKKVGVVIEAFSLVLSKVPEAMLVVVGDGVDLARLKKEAARLGVSKSVKFLGKVLVPDLYEIYKMGSVFATASEIETQGIVLIEAAASGLPLVAVNAGAVAEVCVNGENGFLCEAGNVSEIGGAIEKILVDDKLREKFARRSVEIAAEHDFEKTLDKFLNIYRRVLNHKVK